MEENDNDVFIIKKYKKHTKKKYLTLDQIIKMIKTPIVFDLYPKVKLPTIIEEPENIQIQTDTPSTLNLNHFIHSTSCGDNWIKKDWNFIKNNIIYILSYKTFINNVNDNWYCNNEKIVDLTNFVKDNKIYLENYLETWNILQKTTNIISLILGDPYITYNEIGWHLQQGSKKNNDITIFLRIVLDKFNIDNCVVFYKEHTETMTNKNLLEFINFNTIDFQQLKNQIQTYNSIKFLKSKEIRKQQLIQDTINNELHNLELTNKLKQYEKIKRPCSLYIIRPLKEIYETISCKKFPKKNYWE